MSICFAASYDNYIFIQVSVFEFEQKTLLNYPGHYNFIILDGDGEYSKNYLV